MQTTDRIGKFYYFYPQSVAMVCVADNLMPAAWHTPISAKPPLYGILISPKRHTYDLLIKSESFAVNFLEVEQADFIARAGSTSGRDIKKLATFKIKCNPGNKVDGMILNDSYAAYECRKVAAHEYGDHFLFVGEIILIHYRKDILKNGEFVNEEIIRPVLYFGKDRYLTIDPKTLKVCERGF